TRVGSFGSWRWARELPRSDAQSGLCVSPQNLSGAVGTPGLQNGDAKDCGDMHALVGGSTSTAHFGPPPPPLLFDEPVDPPPGSDMQMSFSYSKSDCAPCCTQRMTSTVESFSTPAYVTHAVPDESVY